MHALGVAIGRYAVGGRLAMARLLLREDTLLAHPEVAYELTFILHSEREPDDALIGRHWQAARQDTRTPGAGAPASGAWYDWSEDASLLVEHLEDELRDSGVFGPVFGSYDLSTVVVEAGPSDDALFAALERLADLFHMRLYGDALELLPGDEGAEQGTAFRGRDESHTGGEYEGDGASIGEHLGTSKGVSGGDVGGDQVGVDKVGQDKVGGDKVGGDKITVGDVSGESGVAIGDGAQAIVNKVVDGENVRIDQLIIYQGDDATSPASGPTRPTPSLIEEAIRLDVAVPSAALLNEPFDLAVAVRQPGAPKLAIEDLTEVVSSDGSVFRTEEAEVIRYRIEVTGSGCEIEPESYALKLRPRANSRPCFFSVTPRRPGVRSLFVNAYQEDESLAASTRIRIEVRVAVRQGQQ
jgi:hypothetical protein